MSTESRDSAKALLHEALHSLSPRIAGMEAGECHCNLLAEVALDALNFAPTGPEPEERAGMCGEAAPIWVTGTPQLLCDLRAGHAGWHEGGEYRTSWTYKSRPDHEIDLAAQVSALQADVAQLAADRDSLRKAGEELERQRDEARVHAQRSAELVAQGAARLEAGIAERRRLNDAAKWAHDEALALAQAQLVVIDQRDAAIDERDEALRMLARHQSEESARWMPAVRERDAMRPVVEAAVAWVRAVSTQPWTDATEAEILAAEHAMCAAVDQMGARTDRGEPQSDENGSGVAQDVQGAPGAQKGAQGAEKCRCGHDSEHHTWRGSGCQCCFGCDSFADHG